jgi:vacuolar protein sorting-associated protein 53
MSRTNQGGHEGTASSKSTPAYLSSGTRVVLPPLRPSDASALTVNGTTSSTAAASGSNMMSRNPSNLLDVFDAYAAGYRNSITNVRKNTANATKDKSDNGSGGAAAEATTQSEPDPIAFLNQHYNSEALLVSELPRLRDSISERMDRLDDRLATAVQRQSESSALTQRRVEEAKANVLSLEERIKRVQTMASQSESTVREITKDMKRLDCAKRHLQRTITTLKRLHMLIHAVERLRLACITKPYPDYMSAAQLVDATRLLLQFFDPHTDKVDAIRLLTQKVNDLQDELKYSLVRGFRLVAFSVEETIEFEKKSKNKSFLASDLSKMIVGDDDDDNDGLIDEQQRPSTGGTKESFPPTTTTMTEKLTTDAMIGGIQLIDSIGIEARIEFMTGFIQDHLLEYSRIYKPVKEQQAKEKPRVSSFMAQPVDPNPKEDKKPDFALEFVEKRFLWLRNLLAEVQSTFPGVFPRYWNIEYHLTKNFLRRVSIHCLSSIFLLVCYDNMNHFEGSLAHGFSSVTANLIM